MTELEKLKAENELLKAEKSSLEVQKSNLELENKKLQFLNKYYEDQLKLNRKKKFGSSSEQMDFNMEQLSFFNEAEATNAENPIVPEPNEETITYKRKKKSKRGAGLANLPVETIEYTMADTSCPKCVQGPN